MTTPSDERQHRSVSQINQYDRCPWSYKLSRLDNAWQKPAAWLAQGSAVHSVAEWFWRRRLNGEPTTMGRAEEYFAEQYAEEIAGYCEETPNFEYWFASGQYRGARDIERRFELGKEQVRKFIEWTDQHPEELIWVAPALKDPRCADLLVGPGDEGKVHAPHCGCKPSTPAIELPFDIDLDGVLVRGYIDAVIKIESVRDRSLLLVRDYKTGNSPGDDFQLAVYAIALAETYGIEPPRYGDYWMGRTGKPTLPYDLSDWTREKVSARFRELDDNVRAERFPPKPSPDNCRFCSVASACEYREA